MQWQRAKVVYRGRMLRPVRGSEVGGRRFEEIEDGVVAVDEGGVVAYSGPSGAVPGGVEAGIEGGVEGGRKGGVLIPPLVDCHIHVPQHPIRGRFLEGVGAGESGGALLAGLARNVYPAELRCGDAAYARDVVDRFAEETRGNGTLGGVAYMTSHPAATRMALERLPVSWRVGLVLMDQNCPAGLAISTAEAERAMRELAADFGRRVVITDRFAVACSEELRRAGVRVAKEFDLETQTHLAEQVAEVASVAAAYPEAGSYAEVYDRSGLLEREAILAHCIHLSEAEWGLLARRGCRVAHCPVSNTLLGSGVMPLDEVVGHGLEWAICTDVGASPTTSLLAELTHFLDVQGPRSRHATVQEALWRVTVGAKRMGRVEVGGVTEGEVFAGVVVRGSGMADVVGPRGVGPGELAEAMRGRVVRVWG